MIFQMRDISTDDHGSVYQLSEGKNLIGRSRSAQIRLLNPDISGKQCTVILHHGTIRIENLSRFGTLVNGQAIAEPTELHEGDQIQVGRNVTLVLETSQEETTLCLDDAQTLIPETAPNDGPIGINSNVGKTSAVEKAEVILSDKRNGLTDRPDTVVSFKTSPVNHLPSENDMPQDVTAETRFASDLPSGSSVPEDVTAEKPTVPDQDVTLTMERVSTSIPGKRKQTIWSRILSFFCFWKKKRLDELDILATDDVINEPDRGNDTQQETLMGPEETSERNDYANK